ncbi:hypothetical protein LPJ53_000762 [Coemansia erecta]|uniref:Bromo domain-containing protein n=1 Tax=Coemansia erecta TaxID=147472 RepID=A0A9W8CUT7_9FUNG|nr:hypothetical protein LPJ53_000762 [Coemansia erecta]
MMPLDGTHSDAAAVLPTRAEQEPPPIGERKLNFLIARYLAQSSLRDAAQPLQQTLERNAASLLPRRVDWQGSEHVRSYAELARETPHIPENELLRIINSIMSSDKSAAVTTGGTVLGRSHHNRTSKACSASSLVKLLKCRSDSLPRTIDDSSSSRCSSRMPLSVIASYKKLVRCHGHKFPTYCVLFDRTGRRMITGSDDFLIKLWCTRTGYLLKTFKGHRAMVSDIAINTENTLLASASTDGSLRVWNLKTGEPRAVLIPGPRGREKGISAVRFSPSPVPEIRYIAATCENGLCYLYRWNRDNLTLDTTPIVIDSHKKVGGNITSLAFNHTGSRLAVATAGGTIDVYSTICGKASTPSSGTAESTVAAASSDGGWGNPERIASLYAHEEGITTLAFSGDGEMFVTGSLDSTVKVWRCTGADRKWTSLTVDVREPVPALEDSPPLVVEGQGEETSQNAATTAASGATATAVVSLAAAAQAAALVASESANLASETIAEIGTLMDSLAAVTPSSTQAATSDMAPVVSASPIAVDHIGDGPVVTPAPLSIDQAPGLAQPAAPDSEAVPPAASADPTSRAQPPTVPATQTLTMRVETNQVAWMCDSKRIIASNNVGTIFAIDSLSGKILWRKRSHSVAEVYVLIPHPSDPRIAVSGGYDGRAIMWNVDNGDILHEFKVGEMLFDGSFSEDGLNFALTSDTGAAIIYGLGPTWSFDDANNMHEQMFANDYTATIMDENHFVADQQTQIPSYLVPHSPIMDFDGRVYRFQRGTRFGADIGMGLDSFKLCEEDAGRLAMLMVELDHVYLDRRAAENPFKEAQSCRGWLALKQELSRSETVEEVPDLEPPLILPPIDDSDDEEYNGGEDEDEEELDDMDEDDEDGIRGAGGAEANATHSLSGRRTRAAGDPSYVSPVFNPRDRRSALEVLRNRHNAASSRPQRSAYRRSTRRVVGGDDDDDDDDEDAVVDVDAISDREIGDDGNISMAGGTRMSLRTSGRARQVRTGTYSEEETAFDAIDIDEAADGLDTANRQSGRGRRGYRGGSNSDLASSDDEFRPGVSASATTYGASTGSRRIRRTGSAASGNSAGVSQPARRRGRPRLSERRAEPASSSYQTRNRRIASDSETEAEEQPEIDSPLRFSRSRSRANARSDANVDIMASSDDEDFAIHPSTTRTRRSNRNAATSSPEMPLDVEVSLELDELPSRRTRNLRSTTNGHADHPDESYQEDHALTSAVSGRTARHGNHMRVPISADNSYEYSDDASDSDDVRGPSTRHSQTRQQQQQQMQRSSSRKHGSSNGVGTVTRSGGSSVIPQTSSLYHPTDWILATTPSTVPYRPQIGDFIVYFKEGHEDFWASPSRCTKLSDKLLPYVTTPSLPVAAYGKVVGLRYAVGPPTYCTVKIQLLKHQSIDELDLEPPGEHELTRRFVHVQYHDCDGVPDFLILYYRYRASLRRSLKSGDSVEVLFDEDQVHQAVITGFRDIKSTSRQTNVTRLIARNPWKSITVEWAHVDAESSGADSESKTEQVSPWELVHDDDNVEMEIPFATRASLLGTIDDMRDAQGFAWFVSNVDYKVEYPDYLLNVAYPMCLDTIYERLEKNFYRHVSAVTFDVLLIQENADTFNDPETPVPIAAQKLVTHYHRMLDEITKTNVKSESDSNSDSDSDSDSDEAVQASLQAIERGSSRKRTRENRQGSFNTRSGKSAAAAMAAMTIKSESPDSPRTRSRKRKVQSSGRTTRRVSRRRMSNSGSDESEFERNYREDNDNDDDDAQYGEEEDEDESDLYNEDEDDDNDDLYS